MDIENAALRESLADAKDRSLAVYRNSRTHQGAERSGAFALGRYEGFKEALRLLERRGEGEQGSRSSGKAPIKRPSGVLPQFSAIFQKLRPKHGPSTLGRW